MWDLGRLAEKLRRFAINSWSRDSEVEFDGDFFANCPYCKWSHALLLRMGAAMEKWTVMAFAALRAENIATDQTQLNSGFTAFEVAQSEPGFTRFGCNASIFS
jgi:hypothetical protein